MKLEKLGPVRTYCNGTLESGGSSPFLRFIEREPAMTGGYSACVSSHCFLCLGERFRLSGMTRVAAGAIPDFRATRRASVPLSKICFRFFIPASGRDSSGSRS